MRQRLLHIFFLSAFAVGIHAQTQIDSLKTVLQSQDNGEKQLETLDLLTKKMIRSNHKEQKEYIKEYMTLAKEMKEYDKMAIKSRFLIQQYIYSGENDKAVQLCDSMLSYKSKFKLKKSEAHILLKKAGALYIQHNYELANTFYDASALLFLESRDTIFAADAYLFSGQSHSNEGDFITALDKYKLAIEFFEKEKDYYFMNYTTMQMADLLKRNGLLFEADRVLLDLVKKCKELNTSEFLPVLYIIFALEKGIYKENLPIAKEYLDSVKSHFPSIKRHHIKKRVKRDYLSVQTQYFLAKKNMKSADDSFQKMMEANEEIKAPIEDHIVDNTKVLYYLEKKEYEKGLKVLNSYNEGLSKLNTANFNYLSSERLLAQVHEALGNEKKAIKHLHAYTKIKDSLNKASVLSAFTYHQAKFKTAEKEKEIQQLEADQALSESKRNTLLAIFFSVVLIFVGVWWRGKLRRKQLSEELERNKAELNQFTQQLILKSGEQELLQNKLNELQYQNEEEESILVIKELAESKILTKEDWYLFKEKFGKVYPEFFIKIFKYGYQLTQSEERLLALEKLGLDNHEISKMLGVSLKTVFMSRYRLRKKVNASKDISLIDYFENALPVLS